MLQVEKQLGSSLCKRYQKSQMVIPPNAKLNTFTVCAVDNIDLNSTSSQKDFHATMCTLHQHSTDASLNQDKLEFSREVKAIQLPDEYTYVESAHNVNMKANPQQKGQMHLISILMLR